MTVVSARGEKFHALSGQHWSRVVRPSGHYVEMETSLDYYWVQAATGCSI